MNIDNENNELPQDLEFDLALAQESDFAPIEAEQVFEACTEPQNKPCAPDVAFDLILAEHAKKAEFEEEYANQAVEAALHTAAEEEVNGFYDDDDDSVGYTRSAVLGELQPNQSYIQNRILASRPTILKQQGIVKQRDWALDFGPLFAPVGFVSTITITPQVLFKGEKIMANDSGSPAGNGTRILSVAVGQRIQRPGSDKGTLTQFFAANALGNGISFDTAHAWESIAVTVSFVQSCTFDLSIFGSAVVEK